MPRLPLDLQAVVLEARGRDSRENSRRTPRADGFDSARSADVYAAAPENIQAVEKDPAEQERAASPAPASPPPLGSPHVHHDVPGKSAAAAKMEEDKDYDDDDDDDRSGRRQDGYDDGRQAAETDIPRDDDDDNDNDNNNNKNNNNNAGGRKSGGIAEGVVVVEGVKRRGEEMDHPVITELGKDEEKEEEKKKKREENEKEVEEAAVSDQGGGQAHGDDAENGRDHPGDGDNITTPTSRSPTTATGDKGATFMGGDAYFWGAEAGGGGGGGGAVETEEDYLPFEPPEPAARPVRYRDDGGPSVRVHQADPSSLYDSSIPIKGREFVRSFPNAASLLHGRSGNDGRVDGGRQGQEKTSVGRGGESRGGDEGGRSRRVRGESAMDEIETSGVIGGIQGLMLQEGFGTGGMALMRALRRQDISEGTREALGMAVLRNEEESHNPVMRQLARSDLSEETRAWLARNTHRGRNSGVTRMENPEVSKRFYVDKGGYGDAVAHSDSTGRVIAEGSWKLWIADPGTGAKHPVGADPGMTVGELRWKLKMVCERQRFVSQSGDGLRASNDLFNSPILYSGGVIAFDGDASKPPSSETRLEDLGMLDGEVLFLVSGEGGNGLALALVDPDMCHRAAVRLGSMALDPSLLVKHLRMSLRHDDRGPGGISGNFDYDARPNRQWPPRRASTAPLQPLAASQRVGGGEAAVGLAANERIVWEGPLLIGPDLDT